MARPWSITVMGISKLSKHVPVNLGILGSQEPCLERLTVSLAQAPLHFSHKIDKFVSSCYSRH